MRKTEPGNHGEALGKVLKEWRANAPLPPRFQEAVWQRIECAERLTALSASSVWAVIAHRIGTLLSRPALGTAYVTILLAVGITAGWAQAREETVRVKQALGERYVRVLDPFQAPRP